MKSRILVVEDDPINASVVFDYLVSCGYDVALVRDGAEAVEKFRTLQPDLLIVDVLLPNVDGFHICFEIRRTTGGDVPILMMSAIYNNEDAQAFAAGDLQASDFLSKPFSLKELKSKVETLLQPDQAA